MESACRKTNDVINSSSSEFQPIKLDVIDELKSACNGFQPVKPGVTNGFNNLGVQHDSSLNKSGNTNGFNKELEISPIKSGFADGPNNIACNFQLIGSDVANGFNNIQHRFRPIGTGITKGSNNRQYDSGPMKSYVTNGLANEMIEDYDQFIADRHAEYVGSFPVVGCVTRQGQTDHIRKQLIDMRFVEKPRPVIIIVCLSGIKVYVQRSPESSEWDLMMAHALKRISYATCYPDQSQFSFLAREPKAPPTVQYCHAFLLKSPQEAEELNDIVANAFKTAYSILQRRGSSEVNGRVTLRQLNGGLQDEGSEWEQERVCYPRDDEFEDDNDSESDIITLCSEMSKDRCNNREDVSSNHLTNGDRRNCTRTECEADQFQTINSTNSSPSVVSTCSINLTPDHAGTTSRSLSSTPLTSSTASTRSRPLSSTTLYSGSANTRSRPFLSSVLNTGLAGRPSRDCVGSSDWSEKTSNCAMNLQTVSPSGKSAASSTNSYSSRNQDLATAVWYQPSTSRSEVMDRLSRETIGSFLVRDSTTHNGCYALSVKVPKYDNPSGISHYLISKTSKGTYKIKGLNKEWSSLQALVIHHSVMREQLPCALKIPNSPVTNGECGSDESNFDDLDDL